LTLKHFSLLVSELNLRQVKRNGYGEINGIKCSLLLGKKNMGITFVVSECGEAGLEEIEVSLRGAIKNRTIASYEVTNSNCQYRLVLNDDHIAGACKYIHDFTRMLSIRSLRNVCTVCRSDSPLQFVQLNEDIVWMCPECVESVSAESRIHNSPITLARGVFGSFLGALAGSLFWILAGYLGYFSSLAGFVVAYLSYQGFLLFKGSFTASMPFFFAVSMIFTILQAELVGFVLDLMKYARQEGVALGFIDAVRWLPTLMADGEVFKAIALDMSLGLVFASLGLLTIIHALNNNKKSIKLTMLYD